MWVCWPFIANRIKRPNEIASQRCDSILGFIVWVLEIWLSRILSLSKFVIIIITIFTFVIIIIIIVIIVNIAIINTIITIIILQLSLLLLLLLVVSFTCLLVIDFQTCALYEQIIISFRVFLITDLEKHFSAEYEIWLKNPFI